MAPDREAASTSIEEPHYVFVRLYFGCPGGRSSSCWTSGSAATSSVSSVASGRAQRRQRLHNPPRLAV